MVSDNLPGENGSAGLIDDEITRQLRLAEDLIRWATRHTKPPLGDFIKKTYRPDLSIDRLNAGLTLPQFKLPDLTRNKDVCDQPAYPSAIIPVKPIIIPGNQKDIENPMIFPGIPAVSPINKRPWPNVFDQLDAYMKDKKGHVTEKTIQVYKNVGDISGNSNNIGSSQSLFPRLILIFTTSTNIFLHMNTFSREG